MTGLGPFIKRVNIKRPPRGCLELACNQGVILGEHDWVAHTHIDENPVIRGHDLCFNKTCQENRLAICAVAG